RGGVQPLPEAVSQKRKRSTRRRGGGRGGTRRRRRDLVPPGWKSPELEALEAPTLLLVSTFPRVLPPRLRASLTTVALRRTPRPGVRSHRRHEIVRLDRQDRALHAIEQALRGVAEKEAGDPAARDRAHHEQVRLAALHD